MSCFLVICYERFDCFALVFYQVKPLAAVECKLLVAGQERKTLGDGMGNDDVVAGIAMVLLLVELEVGVCEGRIAA